MKNSEFYKFRGEHCENCDNHTFYSILNYGKQWLYCTECNFILESSGREKKE